MEYFTQPLAKHLPLTHKFDTLLRYLGISNFKNELLLALTHHSFSHNNNSRYVFLGKYAFKGKLSQWIFSNISGTGQELQHFYGNICNDKYLEKLFDSWQLQKHIRFAEQLDYKTQKHIFVFALLGLFTDVCSPETLDSFIFRFFIAPHDHLLPGNHIKRDNLAFLTLLCKQHGLGKVKVATSKTMKSCETTVSVGGQTFANHVSVSYTYSRKKAIKIALKLIVEQLHLKLTNSRQHKEFEAMLREKLNLRLRAEWQSRMDKFHDKQEKQKAEKEAKKIVKAKEAQELDKKRRQQKQFAKEKTSKTKSSLYRDYSAEEIKNMNPAKRRRLEDLGILPKR